MKNLLTEIENATAAGNFRQAARLVEQLKNHRLFKNSSPLSVEGATARAYISEHSSYLGDYATARKALGPYLLTLDGEMGVKEEALSQIASSTVQADLLIQISHLMTHERHYRAAIELIRRAVDIYEKNGDHYAQANAYHWLSFVRLHQHDYYEAEKCASKSIELICKQAIIRRKSANRALKEVNLSYMIAKSRIWLGVISQRQGLLTKAKAELYTAQELLQSAFKNFSENGDPRAWGDLHVTLGRVYSSEGKYDDAIEELSKALNSYAQAKHIIYEVQTRISLAREYVKKIRLGGSFKEDRERARYHLELAAGMLEKRIPNGDVRTRCLLNLTYSWYYFECGNWAMSERMANEALRDAKRLGSKFLLAECYRARAEAAIETQKLSQARKDLSSAIDLARSVSAYKTLAALVLSLARSYCTKVEPNQVEVDKYLDMFEELKSKHPFESYYLDHLFEKLKQYRSELPSRRAFYFSADDLASVGYDVGLSKYLVWAVRSAQSIAHNNVKKMMEILRFNNLARTYKYIKLADAIEGQGEAGEKKVRKAHLMLQRDLDL